MCFHSLFYMSAISESLLLVVIYLALHCLITNQNTCTLQSLYAIRGLPRAPLLTHCGRCGTHWGYCVVCVSAFMRKFIHVCISGSYILPLEGVYQFPIIELQL